MKHEIQIITRLIRDTIFFILLGFLVYRCNISNWWLLLCVLPFVFTEQQTAGKEDKNLQN